MALIWKDRVKETSTTTGTGTYTLAGAATGFQSFSAIGDGNTCYYCATDGTNWEVGLGTYTSAGTTLARTTVIASSNSGSAVNWAAGTKYVFTTAPAAWMRKNGPGGMSGMRVAYGSATTITIAAGECRDSTDTYDLSLAALVTVSIATAGAALGLDETTLTATATTTGASASVTMSASIWSETAMTATARAATGTIAGGGTTITGTGTAFLSELAPGDVIKSSAKGAARVTAIASDTSLTVAAAFPGGNPAGNSFAVYENLTIQPNTSVAADKFAVNTITDDGLTVVMSAAISSGAGSGRTVKIGVEIASRWYFPWVAYGTSGATGILSTQRTRPYGVSGYTTAWRRVPVEVLNDGSGDIRQFTSPDDGPKRWTFWRDIYASAPANRALEIGVATSYTAISTAFGAPPTAQRWELMLYLVGVYGSAAGTIYLNMRETGTTITNGLPPSTGVYQNATSATQGTCGGCCVVAGNAAGVIDYKLILPGGTLTAGGGYVDIAGWESAS